LTRRERDRVFGRKQHAFTLLELLVALAILAMLSVLGYRAISALTDSELRLSAETTRWRSLDQLFMRLEADVREALPRTSRAGDTVEPAWLGNIDGNGNAQLRFSRAGPEFNVEAGSAGQRLGYRLQDGAIEVLYWPYLDVPNATVPQAYALVDGVARFQIDYLDRNSAWQRVWPQAGEAELPRAIRVTLTLVGGATVERWMVLR
jgi:general secretion pathway protein J